VQAEWDASERVERNPLRWIAKRWVRLSWGEKLITFAPMLIVVGEWGAWLGALIFAVTFCSVLGVALGARHGNSGYRSSKLLSDDNPAIDELGVDVLLKRDGILIGEDWGQLAQVDDWLIYNGHRTTFALQPKHYRNLCWNTPSWDGFRLVRREWLLIEVEALPRVTIWVRASSKKLLFEMLARWAQSISMGNGEPTLPPSLPHPEAFTYYRLEAFCYLVMVLVLIASNVAGFALPARHPHPPTMLDWLKAACLTVLLLVGRNNSLSNLRKLRRFESETTTADAPSETSLDQFEQTSSGNAGERPNREPTSTDDAVKAGPRAG
jgi:hypothetical protein